jgi:hypothetical protein
MSIAVGIVAHESRTVAAQTLRRAVGSPRLPCRALTCQPSRASPALPCLARTDPAVPCLPGRTLPRLACPAMPRRAEH